MADYCNLEKLDVSTNKFGLSGVERLLQAVDISHLRSINLSATIGPGHANPLLKLLAKLLLDSVRNYIVLFSFFEQGMVTMVPEAFCSQALCACVNDYVLKVC